jgi:hypothetical protein
MRIEINGISVIGIEPSLPLLPPTCALLPSSSFQMLQTRLRAPHPTVIIIMTRHHRRSLNYFLPSCLHHLLVASSMPLLESRYSLAFFWSAYDCSIAVATTTNHISLSCLSHNSHNLSSSKIREIRSR